MKSSNMNVERIKQVALITLSILVLAMPSEAALKPLWHKVKDGEGKISTPRALHLTLGKETKDSIKWLVSKESKNFDKFVETFSSEPIKFAEGILEALKSVVKDGDLEKTKKELLDAFKKVDESKFGKNSEDTSNRVGLMKLITAILENKEITAEEIESEGLLEKLLTRNDEELIKALALTDVKPVVPSPSPSPSSVAGTGESIPDEVLRGMAETVCAAERERIAAEKRAQDSIAQLEAGLKRIEEESAKVNEAANRLAALSRQDAENDKQDRKNNFADLLQPLLAQLQQDNNRRDRINPPTAQNVIPPTSSARNDDTSRDFNPVIPPAEQPQPGPVGLLAGPTDPIKATDDIRHILPANRGAREITDAQTAVTNTASVNQKLNAITNDPYLMMGSMAGMGGMMGPVNPAFAFFNLIRLKEAQGDVKNQLATNSANLQNIDKRISALSTMVEKYKDAKLAISPVDLQSEKKLVAAVEERKDEIKILQQSMGTATTDEQKQSIAATIQVKQSDVAAQNRELKSFQDRLSLKLGEVSAEVKTAEKNIEELGDLKTKLETANRTLSDKDTTLSQSISTSQMSVMGMNGLSAGQVLGRPNVNGLQGQPSGSTRPATQRAGIGAAMTGRSSLAAQGGLSATKYDK